MSEPMPGVRPGAESGAVPAVPDLTAGTVPRPAAEPSPDAAPAPSAEAPGLAEPAPLGVPRTPTGVAEVDARLERLADADHLGTGEHLEVYEDVHQGLRDTLTALDRRPGPPAPAPQGPV